MRLSRLGNGELEGDLLSGELLVHTRESVQLVLGGVAVLGVKVHLEEAGPIQPEALTLADNLRGVAQILQQVRVHRGQGAAARAGAGEAGGGHGANAAVGHEHHILTAELLLELTHQPLLDLVEGLQEAEGNLLFFGRSIFLWLRKEGERKDRGMDYIERGSSVLLCHALNHSKDPIAILHLRQPHAQLLWAAPHTASMYTIQPPLSVVLRCGTLKIKNKNKTKQPSCGEYNTWAKIKWGGGDFVSFVVGTHVDDDGGAAAVDIDLLGAVDVEVPEFGLELVVGGLKVEQSLEQYSDRERKKK